MVISWWESGILLRQASVVIHQLGIVGDHINIRKALEIAEALAPSPAPILILGEQVLEGVVCQIRAFAQRSTSRTIRSSELRSSAKELVESILFGHKKGSFTGAMADQIGKFGQANGGTLFLDELAELPLSTQAKLLRVLQDGHVEPIGAKQSHKVDVRIIAATNADLPMAIRDGRFRSDLYYRLNVGEIYLPALRERRTDIPKLA